MGRKKTRIQGRTHSREEILSFLKEISVRELDLKPEQIELLGMDSPIVEGLQLDSVMQVVLITHIEEHFGFVFELEDNGKIETIGDLVYMIQERAEGRNA